VAPRPAGLQSPFDQEGSLFPGVATLAQRECVEAPSRRFGELDGDRRHAPSISDSL
jgi:hypothetical protein